jgi:diaminohydroxyphosphoribosylaminopyrimidine deaminase / 5-amino-6-(5-phosphoribosylamino)uracil reductase
VGGPTAGPPLAVGGLAGSGTIVTLTTDPPAEERAAMGLALALAAGARGLTSPNPWVGCVLVTTSGQQYTGATQPPGGPHAEAEALAAAAAAGADPSGATVFVTLEPCCHHGRTPPCTDALIAAKVARVVVGITDPDPKVGGAGIDQLRDAGIEVDVGVCGDEVEAQLAPYLKHRRTGRPFVTLKLAATMDGRTAAADGSSRWITGEQARTDAHRLRADADAVLVGAGTVRSDDPELTVRHVAGRDPQRVVLGQIPPGAKVAPALEVSGPPGDVLDDLGRRGILSLLVEGGSTVAHEFHRAGLVDRYVLYLAPALMGGDDGRPLFNGPGAPSIDDVWRGALLDVRRLGDDLRVELGGGTPFTAAAAVGG